MFPSRLIKMADGFIRQITFVAIRKLEPQLRVQKVFFGGNPV